MKNNLLPQIEADLEAFIEHAARCKRIEKASVAYMPQAFNRGAYEAYRQAAIRMIDLLMIGNPAVARFWRPMDHETLIDTMIEYQIEELQENGMQNAVKG